MIISCKLKKLRVDMMDVPLFHNLPLSPPPPSGAAIATTTPRPGAGSFQMPCWLYASFAWIVPQGSAAAAATSCPNLRLLLAAPTVRPLTNACLLTKGANHPTPRFQKKWRCIMAPSSFYCSHKVCSSMKQQHLFIILDFSPD